MASVSDFRSHHIISSRQVNLMVIPHHFAETFHLRRYSLGVRRQNPKDRRQRYAQKKVASVCFQYLHHFA